ncbi:MAG: phosphoenolpyruvate carboxykinase (ATP) [Chloroflexota bacterium]|jgi:phosphoenolpyruvate carboxykinase (ATP)|nr:phosphoenolpyruvate carboxykinase (ATP) [Chloroflexota bacterium]
MTKLLENWLESIGIVHHKRILHNPDRATLITEAVLHSEGELTHDGALGVITTPYTGRSPDDKYIVDYGDRDDLWWGDVNRRISPAAFSKLQNRITAYLSNRNLYVVDCFIGADEDYRLSVRIVTEFAWQALAGQNLFIYNGQKHETQPDMVILAAPDFYANPKIDSVESKAAICLDLREKIVLIAASKYVGEIKKSAFTLMNALLPESNVLPMHCSANVGKQGDVALYFGLSGTGKTTLSSTPDRKLIGDDEHGWGENGVFNFEGGCYAKTIRLNPELEPVIWQAANQFGTVLENVFITPEDHRVDYNDARFTENTRAAYPLSRVDNIVPGSVAGHPNNIFFLTADAFGVMPPIAKLTPKEAIYYFLSGYTSKVAGTERGIGQMPKATFSTCFGEPFLPLVPNIYAELLKKKISRHGSHTWLINTGWTGGDYNTGYRMPLPHTRQMVNWILSGKHAQANYHKDPVFEIDVPDQIKGVPQELLYPEKTWEDKKAFIDVAQALKSAFVENFKKYKPYLNE